jgi:hypothetical protein
MSAIAPNRVPALFAADPERIFEERFDFAAWIFFVL